MKKSICLVALAAVLLFVGCPSPAGGGSSQDPIVGTWNFASATVTSSITGTTVSVSLADLGLLSDVFTVKSDKTFVETLTAIGGATTSISGTWTATTSGYTGTANGITLSATVVSGSLTITEIVGTDTRVTVYTKS
ncbi:MAG: hypothetical protein ABSG38_01150 [Spirochaetia bacterium]|jgi:uncharacterized lipoprotein NlpE involved in copper resistance